MVRGKTFDDLVGLLRSYVYQETVAPLQSLGRYLLFGLIGSLLVGFGAVLITIGGVKGLKAWGVFDGWWSWIPYMAGAAFIGLTGGLTIVIPTRGERRRG